MSHRTVMNERFVPEDVAPLPGPEVRRFHEGLEGYRPTPLVELAAVASALGIGSLRLKDESERFSLASFKPLGVTWATDQALQQRPGATRLVAASAGNHGHAVARVAKDRGLEATIFLPALTPRTFVERIRSEGAEVIFVDGKYEDAVLAAEGSGLHTGALLIADVAATLEEPSPEWAIAGYSTLFREAADQSPQPFDVIVVPMGVGSLAASAVRFAVHEMRPCRVIGAEPVAAACVSASLLAGRSTTVDTPGTTMTVLDCPTPSASAWPSLRSGLSGTVLIEDAEAEEAVHALADAGVTTGPSGAAAFAGLTALMTDARCEDLRARAGLTPDANVLCIVTETGPGAA